MANQEHVDLLKQGVDTWNQWRKKYPEIHPDLSEANFTLIKLSLANFTNVDFSMTDLSGANMRMTSLREANLRKAILMGTEFYLADLSRADLTSGSRRN